MPKRRTAIVRDLMVRTGASQWQAEQVEDHPHAGLVLEYAMARGLTPRHAAEDGQLHKVIAKNGDLSFAWARTAYEAWQLARPRIATRPAFHQCRFEVQE